MTEERHNLSDLVLPGVIGAALLLTGWGLLRPETLERLQDQLWYQPTNADYREQQANLEWQAGRKDEAILHYRLAVECNKDVHDPNWVRLAMKLADIYVDRNQLEDAEYILARPLAAHDRNAALHLQMANILALEGRYADAGVHFNAGTARDPENAAAFCAWGVTEIASGHPQVAVKLLQRALEIKPDSAEYHMHLARALRDKALNPSAMGTKADFDAAMKEFETALDKDIKYIPVYVELARTFQSMHDEKAAENFLRAGLEADPRNTPIKVELARFLTTTPDLTRRNLFEAALLMQDCVKETGEQDVKVLLQAAEAWARVKMYDSSVELIDKAIGWGKGHGLTPEENEVLLTYRQKYLVARVPSTEGNGSVLAIKNLAEDPLDVMWPAPMQAFVPLQPSMLTLVDKPLDLSKVPGPGSALDPALYTGDAVQPARTGFQIIEMPK